MRVTVTQFLTLDGVSQGPGSHGEDRSGGFERGGWRDPFTVRMNALPEYVVSNTLTRGEWEPTTVLRGDVAQAVGALRATPGRELQVHGSASLAASLLSAGLVDTLRLALSPTLLGDGSRLLRDCARSSERPPEAPRDERRAWQGAIPAARESVGVRREVRWTVSCSE